MLFKILVFLFMTIFVRVSNAQKFKMKEKCMEDLGCFHNGIPYYNLFERPVSLLPDDREDIDTKFLLFTVRTKNMSSNFSNLDSSIKDLAKSGLNPNVRTMFLIPGYMSEIATYWKMPLVESFLRTEQCNVFLVDWNKKDGPIYEQAVANSRIVGAELALFIKKLQKAFGVLLNSMHLIGHSLGAHISGYAGKQLNKLGRITALDPAGPYFTNVNPIVRLDKSDALFVDAIHTNAAPSRFKGFGLTDSIAHFDFWPNGGHLQPGCADLGSSVRRFLTKPTLDYDGLLDIQCNHLRAIDLFTSSINHQDCEMLGTVCGSWENYVEGKCRKVSHNSTEDILMGIQAGEYSNHIDKAKSLNVFLNTTDSEPFCKK